MRPAVKVSADVTTTSAFRGVVTNPSTTRHCLQGIVPHREFVLTLGPPLTSSTRFFHCDNQAVVHVLKTGES